MAEPSSTVTEVAASTAGWRPGAGYLAFFATGLFLIGLAALPRARICSRETALEPAGTR